MIRPAPIWRRMARGAFWLSIGCVVLFVGVLVGLVDVTPFRPPADWFFTEWLLQAWLDEPMRVLTPPLVVLISSAALQTIASAASLDPAARILRLKIVDRSGFEPSWWQWLLRFVGIVLSWASLGLGFAWAWVSRYGRSLEDLVSSTALMLEDGD